MYSILRPNLYRFMRPTTYSLQLRAEVENIVVKFKWDGGGLLRLELASPTKIYTENQMRITDKTNIRADGIVVCKYLRRYELTIPRLPQEETWTIRLHLENIYRYELEVEAS